uniref:Putative secreted protein n=1 Tax=Anopheles darlingi TaxID=43151 RepID=A0A2M4DJG0_ANODA
MWRLVLALSLLAELHPLLVFHLSPVISRSLLRLHGRWHLSPACECVVRNAHLVAGAVCVDFLAARSRKRTPSVVCRSCWSCPERLEAIV